MARRVLMADVSGERIPGRPRLDSVHESGKTNLIVSPRGRWNKLNNVF